MDNAPERSSAQNDGTLIAALLGIGQGRAELMAAAIIASATTRVRNRTAYLRRALGDPEGIAYWLGQVPEPPPPRPSWCGKCDQGTRLRELDSGSLGRCPDCHPLSTGGDQA